MNLKLCKIRKDKFDELLQNKITEFNQTGKVSFDDNIIQEYSEPIVINGKSIELDIDIEKYHQVADENVFGYTKFAKIGMFLHKDLKSTEVDIPVSIFYEKEVWAYLSMTFFKDIVKKLKLDDDKITEDRIKRLYFNTGKSSRTGLWFLWMMVDRLESENDYYMTHTAFEFVDPARAILERTMGRNPAILRAFVQGIINNDKNSLFKHKKYKSTVPSNISCYASISMLDALEYDELVEVITEQQKMIISGK